MHELSVALKIVESMEQELLKENSPSVANVNLKIGTLTGIVPEALQFVWNEATKESILTASKLTITSVEAKGRCYTCNKYFSITNEQSFICPMCKNPLKNISGGDSLIISSVELVKS